MAVNIAVIDDSEAERNNLGGFLARMQEEEGRSFSVSFYDSAESFFADEEAVFDILIFDIDMPGMNGMDAARLVRKNNANVVILFVTNVAQYAINGYEVDAVDYVLKPVSYYDFVLKINKALHRVSLNEDSTVAIDTAEGIYTVPVSDITYIEVMLHYIIYHTPDSQYRSRSSMKDVERDLCVRNFRRCHKSFLVNLKHVKIVKPLEIELDDGSVVPLSRKYKNQFLSDYISYIKG